jgi:uncharacterized surface protein with fasciclin (FAS1) repeats
MQKRTLYLLPTVLAFGIMSAHANNVVETAQAAGSFNTLITAAKSAGLVEALTGEGPITVFAPTDEAFGKLPDGTVQELLKEKNRQKLANILKYHVIAGKVELSDALKAGTAETLAGEDVRVGFDEGRVKVNEAILSSADIACDNGVIHVIDNVLLPPEKSVNVIHEIRQAIHRGVPLYNHGNQAACARVYMDTSKMLLDQASMPDSARMALQRAVHKAGNTHCHDTRAWMLRHGLDAAFASMMMEQ